jgi:hypothetical protein
MRAIVEAKVPCSGLRKPHNRDHTQCVVVKICIVMPYVASEARRIQPDGKATLPTLHSIKGARS